MRPAWAHTLGHLAQLSTVIAGVRDLVRHDQVVPRIDHRLDVVAHQARARGLRVHRTRIWICEVDPKRRPVVCIRNRPASSRWNSLPDIVLGIRNWSVS